MLFARAVSLAVLVSVLGVAACLYEPSEVIVQVGTNLPPSVPLRIRIVARHGTDPIPAGAPSDYEWTRWVPDSGLAPDAGISLPASFAIVPPHAGPRDTIVSLLVEGITAYETLRRVVRFRIVPQQRNTIPVFLSATCLEVDTRCHIVAGCTRQSYCEEIGETCGDDGNCTGVMQNPTRDAGLPSGCVPYCTHASCGDPDGCGGHCETGTCGDNAVCESGVCVCGAGDARCGATCMPMASIACAPGAMRVQNCGSCGTQSAVCDANCQWGAWGACTGTGCMPGQTQTQSCGNCGTQTRSCVATCTWSAWGACGGQGCAPGSTQRGGCDPCEHQTCSGSCTWSACSLNAGAACTWLSGTHSRSCGACACGRQYCLGSCVWSTGCVSFCGGVNSGSCLGGCGSGC